MKKFFAQIVYSLNILIFGVSTGLFFYISYKVLSVASLIAQEGVSLNVWSVPVILAIIIPIIVPIASFFLVRTLGKLRSQEKLTKLSILGLLGLVGIPSFYFLFIIQLRNIFFLL